MRTITLKILVVSDSHGAYQTIESIYANESPDMVLFLGDGYRDFDRFKEQHPDVPTHSVLGNCDGPIPGNTEKLLEIRDKRIFLLHGHTRNCRFSNMNVIMAAKEVSADVVLYGHTHQPLVDFDGSLFVMNPGTCNVRGSHTYGLIIIENNTLNCFVRKVEG